MTKSELLERHTAEELEEWRVLYEVESEEAQERMKKAKKK